MAEQNEKTDDFPIVDPHQHFWDLGRNYYPWLCDPKPVPFRYGDYTSLKRNYLPPDYLRDAGPLNIVKTVHEDALWEQSDPAGEGRWLEQVAQEYGYPHACVGSALLARDDIERGAGGAREGEAHARRAQLSGRGRKARRCETWRARLDGRSEMAARLRAA